MRRILFSALAAAMAMTSGTVRADHGCCAADDCCAADACCDIGCGSCCTPSGGVFATYEATFLRFHQSGGVQQNQNEGNFDFQYAPRYVVGYAYDNTGIRFRYWDFEDSEVLLNQAGAATQNYNIETYTVDIEGFFLCDICCRTTVEFFGGVRYNSLDQRLSPAATPAAGTALNAGYDNLGITTGLEARHQMRVGSLYANGRLSILGGDYSVIAPAQIVGLVGNEIQDHIVYQTELGLGMEVSRELSNGMRVGGRLGLEYQQWADAVIALNQFGIGNNHNMADAGFAGIAFRAGLSY